MTHSSPKRTSTGDFLNHTVGYWIDRLHKRSPGSTAAGSIIYGAFLPVLSPATTALRPGPIGLGFHHHDLLHCIGSNTLNFIAGMQHCTTSAHVDEGAEAVWHLLLEGQKVWMMARREDVQAVRTQLPADKTMAWWRLEASQREWVHNQRCIMIVQNAGDIIYLPAQWPHTVRHLTDTLALQATMIQSWNSERALQLLDFSSGEVRGNSKYSAAMEWAVAHASELDIPAGQAERMRVQLAQKLAVSRAAPEQSQQQQEEQKENENKRRKKRK